MRDLLVPGALILAYLAATPTLGGNLTQTEKKPTPEQQERMRVTRTCQNLASTAFKQSGTAARYATQGCVTFFYTAKAALSPNR